MKGSSVRTGGSVRRSEDRLRITAQLIDATTGNHLWAERYDRKLKDVFAIHDEITLRVPALEVKLTKGEAGRMKCQHNLDAYLNTIFLFCESQNQE